MRPLNTDRHGRPWKTELVRRVWEKGRIVQGYDAGLFRRDSCGAWIKLTEFGEGEGSEHGWHIDHIRPIARGGDDAAENLQPLHWINNLEKGDQFPHSCEDCALKEY